MLLLLQKILTLFYAQVIIKTKNICFNKKQDLPIARQEGMRGMADASIFPLKPIILSLLLATGFYFPMTA